MVRYRLFRSIISGPLSILLNFLPGPVSGGTTGTSASYKLLKGFLGNPTLSSSRATFPYVVPKCLTISILPLHK